MRYRDLGAKGDLVDGAGDPMPVIPRDAEHTKIADGDEERGQRETDKDVRCTVNRSRRSPRSVPEVRHATAERRVVLVRRYKTGERRQTEQKSTGPGGRQSDAHPTRRDEGRVMQRGRYRVVP